MKYTINIKSMLNDIIVNASDPESAKEIAWNEFLKVAKKNAKFNIDIKPKFEMGDVIISRITGTKAMVMNSNINNNNKIIYTAITPENKIFHIPEEMLIL